MSRETELKKEYFIPEEHIQKGTIANTPHWLRVYFAKEEQKRILKLIDKFIEENTAITKSGVKVIRILPFEWEELKQQIKS